MNESHKAEKSFAICTPPLTDRLTNVKKSKNNLTEIEKPVRQKLFLLFHLSTYM